MAGYLKYTYILFETKEPEYVAELAESELGWYDFLLVAGEGWAGLRFPRGCVRPWGSGLATPDPALVSGLSAVRWQPFVYLRLTAGVEVVVTDLSEVDEAVGEEMDGIAEMIDVWWLTGVPGVTLLRF